MHPTWRDLVIAMLIADDRARRHFLGRCGVHGVELALSTAGGAAGERTLPLIRSDEDWDALTDRLYDLVAELEAQDLIAALAALGAAIDDLAAAPAVGREAIAVAQTVLTRAAGLWNASRRPVAVDLLDAWLSLAKRLEPRPAQPELGVTWTALLPTNTPRPDDRAAIDRFADWLVLCDLLRDYDEPRLEELGFGPDQLALALAFALELERNPDWVTPATEDPALRALGSIARLAPEFVHLPRTVARQQRRAQQLDPPRLSPPEFADLGPLDVGRVLADL